MSPHPPGPRLGAGKSIPLTPNLPMDLGPQTGWKGYTQKIACSALAMLSTWMWCLWRYQPKADCHCHYHPETPRGTLTLDLTAECNDRMLGLPPLARPGQGTLRTYLSRGSVESAGDRIMYEQRLQAPTRVLLSRGNPLTRHKVKDEIIENFRTMARSIRPQAQRALCNHIHWQAQEACSSP